MSHPPDSTHPPPVASAPAAPPDPKSSREAIALAVQARLSGGGGAGPGASPAEAEQRQRKQEETEYLHQLGRVVHLQIKRDNKYEVAAECLKVGRTCTDREDDPKLYY